MSMLCPLSRYAYSAAGNENGLTRCREAHFVESVRRGTMCLLSVLDDEGHGGGILSRFACLAILAAGPADGHHSNLRSKALGPLSNGARNAGPLHRVAVYENDDPAVLINPMGTQK